ncbi:MAG: hypothetical protein WKH64_17580 [Chloroflexia bacterium]
MSNPTTSAGPNLKERPATKIVATIGPASRDEHMLRALMEHAEKSSGSTSRRG